MQLFITWESIFRVALFQVFSVPLIFKSCGLLIDTPSWAFLNVGRMKIFSKSKFNPILSAFCFRKLILMLSIAPS